MRPEDTSPSQPDAETPFDAALRQHFESDAEPADQGFSHAVMAALPARAAQRHGRWLQRAELARWAAVSVAGCGFAALWSSPDGRVDLATQIAAGALVGLLVFWSVPSRWSRG